MKKLSIQLFFGVLAICVLVATGLWVRSITAARPDPATYPMQEIQSVAEHSLPLVIQGLSSAPRDYHLNDSSEVQRLTLGPPIIIYGISQTTLDAPFSGNARTYFDHGTAVHYPLLLDGNTRAYLTVENNDGSWKLGEYGYMDRPWDQLIAKREELSQQRITNQVDFLFVFPSTIFAMYEDKGQTYVMPLRDLYTDFPQLSEPTQPQVYPLEDVLPLLRAHVAELIEQNRQQGTAVPRAPLMPPLLTVLPTEVYPTLIPSTPTPEPMVGATAAPVPNPTP
jgi:hypothetical protein